MATKILDIIKNIFPDGTKPNTTGWTAICDWPPDVFAAVATIAERSGLYSEPAFTCYWKSDFIPTKDWIEEKRELGAKWARLGTPPSSVRRQWQILVKEYGQASIDDNSANALGWKRIVFDLLSTADEACQGVGFPPFPGEATQVGYLVFEQYIAWQQKRLDDPRAVGGDILPYIPYSLCSRVPPTVLCVQPKTNTPTVGCTTRSLTLHIALLPSIANVSMYWQPATNGSLQDEDPGALNVLVVPFPFSIPGKSFGCAPGKFPGGTNDRVFKVDPNIWMKGKTPADLAKFLCGLIEASRPEMEPIHAMVLPELAMTLEFADEVAEILAAETSLDLFLTGVAGNNRNSAAIYQFFEGKVIQASFQAKHHRWCLNEDQIRRYNLGHVLDPHRNWWEQIDVSFRLCYVMVFRPGATLSVLICEDLARYDPVVTVMNAVGPNLVVALLMDGPQLEHRWPARYATVLADDPGSAVLTVTSLGMVARSARPGDPDSREIALWKERDGQARALKLPRGDHALLLSLTSRVVEQFTLDGRGDDESTVHFKLGAARGIRHPDPPAWLGPLS